MLPGKIDLPASDVITETKIARNVILRTPFMSSPMDTITETDIAISPALLDGIRKQDLWEPKPVGIVTSRDVQFESPEKLLRKVMTSFLVTALQGVTLTEANQILRASKKGKLFIVDEQGRLIFSSKTKITL
ncbi:hypothetical protein EV424DRAFT_1543230 [Suillus variegatus]|nr:hypothetical protein EV424DRAFT_1543230 [Suillus variegatus]